MFGVSDLRRMFTIPLNNRIEFCHLDDAALAILNAVKNFDAVKGNTLVISGGPSQRMLYEDMISAILGVLGLPLPPAHKFTQEPYYLDWLKQASPRNSFTFSERLLLTILGITPRSWLGDILRSSCRSCATLSGLSLESSWFS